MYSVPLTAYDYSDPWVLPFAARVRQLRRAKTRVAYFYSYPDNSTFRYRCYSTTQCINAHSKDVSAGFFHASDGHRRLLDLVSEIDALVICRSMYTETLAALIAGAISRGIPVFYDVDDLVFDPAFLPIVTQSINQKIPADLQGNDAYWHFWFGMFARYRAAMLLCDGTIATNTQLASEIEASTGLPSSVVPNFMSIEQAEYSKQLYRARRMTGDQRDDRLHIGYFSGTPTHARDFQIVHSALERLLRKWPEVVIRLVGYIDLAGTDLECHGDRIELHPFQDYMNLQHLIASTEINIAPLQDNRFTNCKSELKFFDAAAVGVPTFASPTFTMLGAYEHGRSGFHVPDHQWFEALDSFICDYGQQAEQVSAAAFDVAHTKYSSAPQLATILESVGLG